ncbi:hypothetical protein AeRB84_015119 [Aphanomyces euteiches]|nr:hypothetical protein AeRB84_015119 [Aphanomyces euteiches]
MDTPPATSTIDVSHFSPEQQATLTDLLRLIPENIVRGLFSGVNPQDQIIVIESFRLHGEATAQSAVHAAAKRTQEEAALLYEADLLKATAKIAGLEESNRNLASHARRSDSPSSGIDDIFIDSRVSRDRPLKLKVSKYGGAPDEHLFRWFSEVKLALGAQLVTNETLRVAFALSNLQGRARDWAYNLHMLDDEAFPSFESLVEQLKEQYVHSNVETRFRAVQTGSYKRPSEEEPSSLLALSEVRSDLFDRIRGLYSLDPALSRTIDAITAGKSLCTKVVQIGRFTFHDDLLWYTVTPEDAPRVAVPCDPTLRAEIIREFHDTPSGGHFGRDKTYLSVARSFWWPRL